MTVDISKTEENKGINWFGLILMCVVLGVLAAIAIPNFLPLDGTGTYRRFWYTGRGNVDDLRSVLASYAADSPTNRYPVGDLNYEQIRSLFPYVNLASTEKEAKWTRDSFSYRSENGETYTIRVCVGREPYQDIITGTPSGITPNQYPH